MLLFNLHQVVPAQSGTSSEKDILNLFISSGPLEWVIIIILILFSAMSWGIIFGKLRALKKARQQSILFLNVFRKSNKFSEVNAVCNRLRKSPLVGLFLAAYSELNYQLRIGRLGPESRVDLDSKLEERDTRSIKATIQSMDGISRALQRATAVEVNRLERSLNFLATTASVCPFIGLLGTVIGIVKAFSDIGMQGQASLATVAPGISAALVATAVGLFAAIPAVIGYNYLLNKIKITESQMDDFSLEFISITERNFT
jgi:biopolymer transport protein TolQ